MTRAKLTLLLALFAFAFLAASQIYAQTGDAALSSNQTLVAWATGLPAIVFCIAGLVCAICAVLVSIFGAPAPAK